MTWSHDSFVKMRYTNWRLLTSYMLQATLCSKL
jgi:hypothetical protein